MKYDYDFDPAGDGTAARLCRLVGHDKTVLELGCAAGTMTQVLKEHYGCRVSAIEFDAQAAEHARPYCEALLVADLEQQPMSALMAGQRFEVVLMADVIEHLRDTQAQLAEIKKLLAPGGQLVLSIPNVAHSGIIAQLLCGQFTYTPTGLLDSTHIRFFTADSMRQELEQAGFTVTHTDTVDTDEHHPEFAAYWQQLHPVARWLLRRHRPGRAYQLIFTATPTAG